MMTSWQIKSRSWQHNSTLMTSESWRSMWDERSKSIMRNKAWSFPKWFSCRASKMNSNYPRKNHGSECATVRETDEVSIKSHEIVVNDEMAVLRYLQFIAWLAKHMMCTKEGHYQAILQVMTSKQGLLLNQVGVWHSKKGFQFLIKGYYDSDYVKCVDTTRKVTGCRTFLNGLPVISRSSTKKMVSLSMTGAKDTAGFICAQDVLYAMQVIK